MLLSKSWLAPDSLRCRLGARDIDLCARRSHHRKKGCKRRCSNCSSIQRNDVNKVPRLPSDAFVKNAADKETASRSSDDGVGVRRQVLRETTVVLDTCQAIRYREAAGTDLKNDDR